MVEMDKIVSGKRGWVTRASTEYARNGDRPSEPAIGSSIDKAVNLYNTAIAFIRKMRYDVTDLNGVKNIET